MSITSKKLLTVMAGFLLFSVSGLSVVYAQNASESGNGSYGGIGVTESVQNQHPASNATTVLTVPTTPSTASANSMLPPLQQVRLGVAANAVVCQGNFQLILKTENGSPACVDSTTFALLVERGWGHSP